MGRNDSIHITLFIVIVGFYISIIIGTLIAGKSLFNVRLKDRSFGKLHQTESRSFGKLHQTESRSFGKLHQTESRSFGKLHQT